MIAQNGYQWLMSEESEKHDVNTERGRLDRLSALMSRFALRVRPCDGEGGDLLILGRDATPASLLLHVDGQPARPGTATDAVLLRASVSWGGRDNPLLAALPAVIHHPLQDDPEIGAIVALMLAEIAAPRCGGPSVLDRLGEVLIVRLLRLQIERGATRPGLLGGLADPRLSRAIVAMHDRPGHPWRVETLADEAGLSISRFAELFRDKVGLAPLAYLRNWRLVLARQDIERGHRIQTVARRYGYGSAEALSRAVSQACGLSPLQLRKAARARG